MVRRLGSLAVLALAACAHPHPRPAAPGMIAGLIRDAATGAAIENAIVVVRRPGEIAPLQHESDVNGAFMIPELPPGHYEVAAYAAKALLGEHAADVRAGEVTGLDFIVGSVEIDPDELNAPGAPALWHYRPRGADPLTGVIEGMVSDLHNVRLASAVVSVTSSGALATQQAVTDERGRFSVPALAPGSYDVSAYYSVVRLGQIEVRRSRVIVGGGEVVVVPLWLDTDTE